MAAERIGAEYIGAEYIGAEYIGAIAQACLDRHRRCDIGNAGSPDARYFSGAWILVRQGFKPRPTREYGIFEFMPGHDNSDDFGALQTRVNGSRMRVCLRGPARERIARFVSIGIAEARNKGRYPVAEFAAENLEVCREKS